MATEQLIRAGKALATPFQNRIRLAQLRLLVCLAESGSLLAAAKHLNMSQPAATKSLRMLEETAGDALVRRTSKGSSLTSAGELVYRRARVVLSELNHLEEELASYQVGSGGQVVVGASPVAAPQLVPQVVAMLAVDYPLITVRVLEATSASAYDDLKLGKLDLIVGRSWPGQDKAFIVEPLFDSGYAIAARPGHAMAAKRRRNLTLATLSAVQWIVPAPGTHARAALEAMFASEGLTLPQYSVETSSYLVIRSLLQATDMLCLLPIEALSEDLGRGVLTKLPVKVDLALPAISAIRSAERDFGPAARVFLKYLKLATESKPPRIGSEYYTPK